MKKKSGVAERDRRIVQEVRKRYGAVIDLKAEPGILIEILRNFGGLVVDDPPGTSTVAVGVSAGTGTGGTGTGGTGTGGTGTGGTGTGGTGTGGTSTVAVGITPPEHDPGADVTNAMLLRALLDMRSDIRSIGRAVKAKL